MKKMLFTVSIFSIVLLLVSSHNIAEAAKRKRVHVTAPAPVVTTTPTPTVFTPTTSTSASSVIWNSVVIYDGYGTVTTNDLSHQLSMTPKAATQPGETHAALVIGTGSVHQPYQLSYTMTTTKQLRTGSAPNAWEVGWVMFGYKSTGAFKYLVMKPNGYGLELGESLLNNQQNFLYTSTFGQDLYPVNTAYNVVLHVQNNVITATINGKQSLQYTMSTKDALNADGQYGFYTEDAAVTVSNINMQQL